jgi:outer membrane protein assembly factor BamD (BamD/ComL family)
MTRANFPHVETQTPPAREPRPASRTGHDEGIPSGERGMTDEKQLVSHHHSSLITQHFFFLLLILSAGAGVVLGCGWNGFENSVRFNFSMSERDRQRLPPLPHVPGGRRAEEESYLAAEQRASEAEALWRRAGEASGRGELESARVLLREFVARAADDDERLNSAVDQLDALAALDAGSSPEHVRVYLDARREFDARPAPPEAKADADGAADDPQTGGASATAEGADAASEGARQTNDEARPARGEARSPKDEAGQTAVDVAARPAIGPQSEQFGAAKRDRNLADNFAYLNAATLYRTGQPPGAAAAFRELAARHPRSEKREAALFMAARSEMSQSHAYLGPGATATSEDACPDCRDEAWRAAREGFSRLAREYPRGRLTGEARGWLAYLSLRVGDTAGALAEYYRMLADETDAGANGEALKSLRLARGRAGRAEMERVEAELEDEPRAALAYAYHDIYNYTSSYYFVVPDLGPDTPYAGCFSPYAECRSWEREQASEVESRAEREGLARVARFATRMMARHPGAQVGGAFTVRVAEANLEMGETDAALGLARRALGAGVSGSERAAALWVAGVAEYRRRELGAARRTLARLAAEFPGGETGERARTLLAVAAEEAGDLDAALEQYLALGYEADVAYFVDVLLTPEQLAAFVERRPRDTRADELLYALGVRLLRAGRYREARAALQKVRTTADDSPDHHDDYYGDERQPEDPKYRMRSYFYEEDASGADGGEAADRRDSGVSAAWVLRDLKTAEDLERLSLAAERAGGTEAKAEALYQLASYLYEGSNLKFYNPAAWRGMRAEMLGSLDDSRYRSPGEAEAVWRHAREHESPSRALEIYLDIVRRYPDTRAARDAFYTAILCHQRLSGFNAYWRDAYELGLHAGERVVTYADLRRAYPRYRAPVPGYWRPSTRTVDGGPAWPAPPAPKKLTGTERARRKLLRAEALAVKGWALSGEVAGGRARRWSLALVCAAGILCLWRATRRSRATLYELLRHYAARRARPPEVVARPSSSYASHHPYTAGARLHTAAANLRRTLLDVALDERGRAAIALNLLTHGLLTALLWALAWALRAG